MTLLSERRKGNLLLTTTKRLYVYILQLIKIGIYIIKFFKKLFMGHYFWLGMMMVVNPATNHSHDDGVGTAAAVAEELDFGVT